MSFFKRPDQSWTEWEVATKSVYIKKICITVFMSLLIVALVVIQEFFPAMEDTRGLLALCISVLVLVFALALPLRYLTALRKLVLQRDGEPDTSPPSEMLEEFIAEHEQRRSPKASSEGDEV